ncbi:hypothetical protein RF11_01230 [Thelohanellus kitauei]|uniref:Tc1-like transposase DDE domain-containing protein n=1 Tax=Thelohanellus kitauei TaxID=669202 RepID=A0A0C2MTQ0_THEKT|nr:hypothetical protein RF11_01230 [Thelohanellus kitauei]
MINSQNQGPESPKRVNKTVSNETRALVISALNNGIPFSEIPSLYNVSESNARKIFKVYQDEGRIKKLPKGGNRRETLTDEQKKALCDILNEDSSRNTHDICAILLERHNISIDPSTVSRYIREFKRSLEINETAPKKRFHTKYIKIRQKYASECLRIEQDRNKIIFIDEMILQMNMMSQTDPASNGVQETIIAPEELSRKYSVLCAMSCEGLINFKVSVGPYCARNFMQFFFDTLKVLKQRQISGAYLVMNKVQFQRTKMIRKKMMIGEHMAIVLPPDSPFLNPMESLFADWKELVGQTESRTEEEFLAAIKTCGARITGTDCFGFYRKMKSYLIDCKAYLPIENKFS